MTSRNIFPTLGRVVGLRATRCIAPWQLHATRGLFSEYAQIWNDGKRRSYLVGDSPEAVNAEPSILNLRFCLQRHSDLRIIALAGMYALISPRNDGSSPETKFSIEKLEIEGQVRSPVIQVQSTCS